VQLSHAKAYLSGDTAIEVGTTLYPHQKKALTFLLEREREKPGPDGKFSSLWQARNNPFSREPMWFHIVTQKEVTTEPPDCKGAVLADDVCICVNPSAFCD
jgi:SWI/SNF-related matrix-associated actin-dependent regulator of chromatin subfamily A3